MTTSLSPATAAVARPFTSFQMRAEVRLFHTNQDLACREDPEAFFGPRQRPTAVGRCAECPFRGRCGYNAVAMGATHGIWGGVMLPGDYPSRLKPVYARLSEQLKQRRLVELGDVPVAPLPELDTDGNLASGATSCPTRVAAAARTQSLPPGSGRSRARSALPPAYWPLDGSRIA
jgi:WhiB family transcriptional regulator, redox-sensing transcriptional regulator